MPEYTLTDFEREAQATKPRFIDVWLLPPLVMFAAVKSKDLGRWTRRAMFTAGVYMLYRNWTAYKEQTAQFTEYLKTLAPAQSAATTEKNV